MKTEITAKGTQEAKDSGTVNSFYTGTEGGEWGKVFRLGGGCEYTLPRTAPRGGLRVDNVWSGCFH